jgi:GT2 family glycosyltransferase
MVYPNGRIQHAGVGLALWGPVNLGVGRRMGDPHVLKSKTVFGVLGACMLIKKKLFSECKGFDEEFAYGYEDFDLCLKVLQRGHKNFYASESLVYHYESATYPKERVIKNGFKDAHLFEKKWEKFLSPLVNKYIEKLRKKGIKKIIIYGTGRAAMMLYFALEKNGFEVIGFIDYSAEKWGKRMFEKKIFSHQEAKSLSYDAVMIGSQFVYEIEKKLTKESFKEKIIVPIILEDFVPRERR